MKTILQNQIFVSLSQNMNSDPYYCRIMNLFSCSEVDRRSEDDSDYNSAGGSDEACAASGRGVGDNDAMLMATTQYVGRQIFTFRFVNSYGSTDVDSVPDDGSPVQFGSTSFLQYIFT